MAELNPELLLPPFGTTCVSTSEHSAEVNVAVRLQPNVVVKSVETECCGRPEIRHRYRPNSCCQQNGCDIFITQPILIKLSLDYGASANPGEPHMECRPRHPFDKDKKSGYGEMAE